MLATGYMSTARKAATELQTDLEDLGYYVALEASGTTNPATWTDYDLLVFSAGDNTSPLSSATLRAALETYVAGGGRLLIEGGEVGYDAASYPGYPSLAQNVLHITDWNHDQSGNLTVTDPGHYVMSVPNLITGPISFTYNGYGDQDAVVPTADAARVASWSTYPTDASIVTFDTNPGPQAGQIVFYAFNYAAMAAASRSPLLQNTVEWLLAVELGNASVSGQVTLEGEASHDGVEVVALPGGTSVITGADGTYTLTGLYAGTYQIQATKDGWSDGLTEVTLSDGEHLSGVDFLLSRVYESEVCSACNLGIPDNNPVGISNAVTVAQQGEVTGVEVYVNITHTFIGDLRVSLTSPEGTVVMLHNQTGGTTNNLIGWYPTGLDPAQSLDAFLGQEMAGDWTLKVSDHASVDTGYLVEWCVRISYPGGLTDVSGGELPRQLALADNYPNPFNPATTIQFELPRALRVDLAVYDVSGRRLATLVSEQLPAGRHRINWLGQDDQGRAVASGTYFYRLHADGRTLTRKMLLLK
jgi:subtilisin-like proprotein convertase family protein